MLIHHQGFFVLSVVFLIIVIAEWLNEKPFFRHLGTGLMVIIFGAVAANSGIIPASSPPSPVYDAIFTYVAPLSIFLILLNVNLASVLKAGKPMLRMFLIGAAATVLATCIALWWMNGKSFLQESWFAIGGMLTGSYIGGSINFNAVAINYGISREGDLFAATTVADNVISAVWVAFTLLIPGLLQRYFPKMKMQKTSVESPKDIIQPYTAERENVSPMDIALLLGLSFGAYLFSVQLQIMFPVIPMIIWLTSLALIASHIPFIHRLRGHKMLGLLGIYLFLTVIGAHCDIPALMKDGTLAINIMVLVTLIVMMHGLIIFAIGALMREDWDVIAVASQANIGGTATAMALAKSLNRNDLLLPGILVGALGNAGGTYIGILMAEWLRNSTLF